MAAYIQQGRASYQTDVTDRQGRTRKGCATGVTRDAGPDAAHDVDKTLREWRKSRDVGGPILAAIVDGELALADAYEAHLDGKLESTLRALEAARTAHAEAAAVVDLDPLVTQWAGAGARPQYVTYVRRLIPEGVRFPVSDFRPRVLSAFLDGLTFGRGGADTRGKRAVAPGTRNRYRSALSVFGAWLVQREYLERNLVRDVASYRDPDELPRQLTRTEITRVLAALPSDVHRAAVALMAHGAEWGAVAKARAADLDVSHRVPVFTAHPAGTGRGKTKHRSRFVALTERWLHPSILPYHATLAPDAPVVPLTVAQMEDAQDAAFVAAGVARITLHGWRHTYAITALRRKDDHQDIKRNLGHAPQSTLLYTTYGSYLNDPRQSEGSDG